MAVFLPSYCGNSYPKTEQYTWGKWEHKKERFILSTFDAVGSHRDFQSVPDNSLSLSTAIMVWSANLDNLSCCWIVVMVTVELWPKDVYQKSESGQQNLLSIGRADHLHRCGECAERRWAHKRSSDPDTWSPGALGWFGFQSSYRFVLIEF